MNEPFACMHYDQNDGLSNVPSYNATPIIGIIIWKYKLWGFTSNWHVSLLFKYLKPLLHCPLSTSKVTWHVCEGLRGAALIFASLRKMGSAEAKWYLETPHNCGDKSPQFWFKYDIYLNAWEPHTWFSSHSLTYLETVYCFIILSWTFDSGSGWCWYVCWNKYYLNCHS